MSDWKPRYPKIIVELVPEPCFGRNIRSLFPKEWEHLRQICYARAKHKCEICGDAGVFQGFKQCVEAHELWEYDSLGVLRKGIAPVQRLKDLVALCPLCHRCHHLGFAEMQGQLIECFDRIAKINKISNSQVNILWKRAQILWTERSRVQWNIDTSFISEYLAKHKKHKAAWAVI